MMDRSRELTLEQADLDLGLQDSGDYQDWGIVHSDASRLLEFINYYLERQSGFRNYAIEYYLGELLLESANDALLEIGDKHALVDQVLQIIVSRRYSDATQPLVAYWSELDRPGDEGFVGGEEVYPVSRLLRQALDDRSF